MATLSIHFTAEPSYTGDYTVRVYKATDTGTLITAATFSYPFSIPVTHDFAIPTFENYIIKVYAIGCGNKLVGTAEIDVPV